MTKTELLRKVDGAFREADREFTREVKADKWPALALVVSLAVALYFGQYLMAGFTIGCLVVMTVRLAGYLLPAICLLVTKRVIGAVIPGEEGDAHERP